MYEKLALILTKLENPRTQADFDNSYVYKCFALSFINYYSAVGYIAFIKVSQNRKYGNIIFTYFQKPDGYGYFYGF